MMNPILRTYFYPDVSQLERAPFEALFLEMGKHVSLSVFETNDNHAGLLEKKGDGNIWIIAKQWHQAIQFLGAGKYRGGKVFISALDLDSPRQTVYHVLAKKIIGILPRNCTLLTHSPVNYRFFSEMEGVSEKQIAYLPLPVPLIENKKKEKNNQFTFGVYTPFSSDGQLNFIASIAHYVLSKNNQIKFRVLGAGSLYHHMIDLGNELGLDNRFTVSNTASPDSIGMLDGLIFCPLRNDHFIPLTLGASYALPCIATEMAGIEDYIQDGKTGFIVPVNETKTFGELLLRLSTSSELASAMGRALEEQVQSKFNVNQIAPYFMQAILGGIKSNNLIERAA